MTALDCRYGEEWVRKYDLSSLRVLASVGEPLNSEAWHWLHTTVGGGKCDLVDTWWQVRTAPRSTFSQRTAILAAQTETGGVAIAPRPSRPGAPLSPGKPQRPMWVDNKHIIHRYM